VTDVSSPNGEYTPGRLSGHGPVAVIDIGSNSVRLVVYERLSRTPTVFFNEKILAGLGRGVAASGSLEKSAVDVALAALRRFRQICNQSGTIQVNLVATSAVREAANGDAFISAVEDIMRVPVQVLTGGQEARYAAFGVISGIWRPNGMVADLGGGSLELVDVQANEAGTGTTLPLGVLRLIETTGNSVKAAEKQIDKVLATTDLLDHGTGRAFYAVGGTWRSLARLHMVKTKYPLHVMHEYTLETEEAAKFCRYLTRTDIDDIGGVDSVSRQRRMLLPFGAAVLKKLLERIEPSKIVISALGVREGLLYELLDDAERSRDPLIAACEELAFIRSRSPRHAAELGPWTDRLFHVIKLDETAEERRLRLAACLLGDIGWRAHPDYRGEQSQNIIAHAAFVGIDHPGRAYLSLAVFYRHVGLIDQALSPNIKSLVSARMHQRARIVGTAMRVAYLLSAAMPELIPRTDFRLQDGELQLLLPPDLASIDGERVRKRFGQLGKLLNMQTNVVIMASTA